MDGRQRLFFVVPMPLYLCGTLYKWLLSMTPSPQRQTLKFSQSGLVLTLVLNPWDLYYCRYKNKKEFLNVLTTSHHGVINSTSPELNELQLFNMESDRDLMEVVWNSWNSFENLFPVQFSNTRQKLIKKTTSCNMFTLI